MKDLSNENVINVKKDGYEFLQFRKLLEYSNVITHAYCIGNDKDYRTLQVSNEVLPEDVYYKNLKNYQNIGNILDINFSSFIRPVQNHTKDVKFVDDINSKDKNEINFFEANNVDGLITNKSDIALVTTNADCILMMFFDPVKKIIANIHSGWKGTFQKISKITAEKLINEYGCNPEDLICCMTPSIRKCHFEVDEDIAEECKRIFDYTGRINDIIEKNLNNKFNIDTILINKILLKQEGLKEENIIDSGICNVCNSDQMHSFRVEKENYGLNTAIIELK